MADREPAGPVAREFFEGLWQQGDYWGLERSAFEASKYARQIALVGDRRYANILEIGCGGGLFTRALAALADRVVALDVAPAAITRARARGTAGGVIDFREADVMRYDPAADGPFDLIVMTETIYYLGWLNSFFDVSWLAAVLFDATSDRGRLLLTNSYGGPKGFLHRPWLLRTYCDLFRNVGYGVELEEPFTGDKDGTAVETLICLFAKPAGANPLTTS